MHRSLRRLSLLAAVTVAVVGLTAGPAAAAGWDITGGTITLTPVFGPDIEFDLANPEEDDCTEQLPEASIDVEFDSPSSGDVSVDFSSQGRSTAFGTTYEATITGSGTGTYTTNPSPPPDYFVDLEMDFTVEFHTLGAAPDCTPSQNVVCTWTISNVPFVGEYNGSIPPSTGDDVTLSTSSPGSISVSGCSGQFALLLFSGGDVTVDNLTAVYV